LIPDIVHFIWLVGTKSRDFGFVNYLAVRAAAEVQKPLAIFMHTNGDIIGNPYWDAIRPYVTMVPVTPPEGVEYPQHQADILRLGILFEHGGMYLDTDMIMLRPVGFQKTTMGIESYDDDGETPRSLNAGLIVASHHCPFIGEWSRRIRDAMKVDRWADHCVLLPLRILEEKRWFSPPVDLRPKHEFLPFDFHDEWISGSEHNSYMLSKSYSLHLYDTYWEGVEWSELSKVNNEYLLREQNLFTHLFRKYAMNKKLNICVYAISKNEEMFVERFCEAAKDADTVFIADTGSTDRTVAKAIECGADVAAIAINPWRFDDARNAALALIPRDVDVCVSLDLDEELQPGWREEIERVWTPGTTRLRYGFDWGCGIIFHYEKIHARHGYRWLHPCHEYPVPYLIEERYAHTDMLMVVHKPDPTKSRGQYLPLLEMSVKEDPIDPRNAFYYARELSFHGHWQEAIAECERYLALPGATWANERCYAYRVMARCWAELGDVEAALKAARMGVIEAPNTREPWCEIAKLCYREQRWAECYGAAKSALAIEQREWVYTVDPEVWGAMPHDYASIAAWNLGMRDEAIRQIGLAIEKNPTDERLQANMRFFVESSSSSGS
jgi:tetratricopeptide (TPR) repeat protein